MRTPPKQVVTALKGYDADLGLEWCDRACVWWFTWRGTRWWSWVHDDGVEARNRDHLSADEALRIVKAADNHRTGGIRLKAMLARRRELAQREEEYRRRALEESDREAAAITATWRRGGPKPFIRMPAAACT
jgi:hypothetical protein